MRFCTFISLHSQSKYKISYLFAEAIKVWRRKPQISQGHLGGRDGSNSCTLIAIILGRMFCLSESELAIANQNSNTLKNSWVHALANAIVDGNTVYDKNILNQQISPACYLDVEKACTLARKEFKIATVNEPLPVWFQDSDDSPLATIDYQLFLFSLKKGKHCSILTSNGKSSVILSEGKGKLFLVDTHYDILSGSGSKFVLGNAQGASEFIRKEARQFTMVEFLS